MGCSCTDRASTSFVFRFCSCFCHALAPAAGTPLMDAVRRGEANYFFLLVFAMARPTRDVLRRHFRTVNSTAIRMRLALLPSLWNHLMFCVTLDEYKPARLQTNFTLRRDLGTTLSNACVPNIIGQPRKILHLRHPSAQEP